MQTGCLNAGVCRIVNQLDKYSVVLLLKCGQQRYPILAITQREDTNDGAQQSANAHPNNAKKNEKKDKASPKADRILLSQQRNSSAPKKSSSKHMIAEMV